MEVEKEWDMPPPTHLKSFFILHRPGRDVQSCYGGSVLSVVVIGAGRGLTVCFCQSVAGQLLLLFVTKNEFS